MDELEAARKHKELSDRCDALEEMLVQSLYALEAMLEKVNLIDDDTFEWWRNYKYKESADD